MESPVWIPSGSKFYTSQLKILKGAFNTHLHVTNCDTIVSAVSDDLVLDLLPTLHTLLNEHLGTDGESLVAQLGELLFVLGETGTETTKGKGSSNDDWVADGLGRSSGFWEVDSSGRLGALFTNLLHGPSEHFSVLGGDDGLDRGTEDLDTELGKLVFELDSDAERGLSTESAVDTIWFLVLDDLEHKVWGDWQEVDLVGETLGSLNRGNVGIDQDGVDAFFLERLDGLGTRVVKLSSLSDRQTSGTEHENFSDLFPGSESDVVGELTAWNVDRDQLSLGGRSQHALDEHLEEELGVSWSRSGLWVELGREEGFASVSHPDTLVTVVVGVGEQWLPSVLQCRDVDLVSVVLRGDVASTRVGGVTWDVHASVSVLHLPGRSTGGESE
jgi:hypothetical protein